MSQASVILAVDDQAPFGKKLTICGEIDIASQF